MLISSAKSSFDTARSEVMQMAAKVALLDRVLKLYGPETADARRELREPLRTESGARGQGSMAVQFGWTPNEEIGDAFYLAWMVLHHTITRNVYFKTQAGTLMMQLAEIRALVQAQAVSAVLKPLLIALVLVAGGHLLWL